VRFVIGGIGAARPEAGTVAKILVVDDHPDIARLIQRELENEGHTIVTASDGEEALRLVAREEPAVVVLDVILPKMDGFEVLRALRSDPATRGIRVIMLTVMDQDGAVSHGLELGADWYVAKPFVPGDIASLVRRFLQSATG
jgi:two-component system alkaline phosphatase synthesis response regulator PhoP